MGNFVGDVLTKWLVQTGNDRNMELLGPFSFIADDGTRWDAPAGAVVNGASIPRALWVFGPPFVGDYRRASVIHDYYCETKTRDWKSTHRIFYHGCIADGVSVLKAKAMYAAVYSRGPRWDLAPSDLKLFSSTGSVEIPKGSKIDIIAQIETTKYDLIIDWINEENPTLDEIEKKADEYIAEIAAHMR